MSIRLKAQRPRDWALAIGGGLALAAGLVAVLRGSEDAGSAPPPPAVAAPPMIEAASAMPAPAPPATAPAVVTGLTLRGIIQRPDGAAAIIDRDGRQRLVRVGEAVVPGLVLRRLGVAQAVLAGPGGDQLLRFPDDSGLAPPAPATVTDWRLALEPVRDRAGLHGWRVRDVARLPQLAAAGVRAGDVLTDVNGTPLFSEEKILELPQELAANPGAKLGIERQGRPQIVSLP